MSFAEHLCKYEAISERTTIFPKKEKKEKIHNLSRKDNRIMIICPPEISCEWKLK